MRLKRVEMIGFKSFMDRTVLDFRDGITCVLGPNGCGKSNVVDAVRWVLGEQSAKQLRGEKMEDVIFKGTRKRKPLSMAEVSLVFDNRAGRLNLPYDEVAVTRRVSRAGTSDYFLNKTPCRLKDIKDLFYDTGVGNNAYSVIEQEVVGQVLDPNENKVRTILEEGSGIVRYKVKRKEALRKLDLTERDLLRVEDIIEEIGRQVRSLARQVGKARRHQRLFGEVRSLELIRAWLRLRAMEAEAAALRERLEELQTAGSGDDAESARLGAEVESLRPALEEMEQGRRERAEALSQVEATIHEIESELLVLREKIDSGSRRRTEIAEELERSRVRLAEVEGEREGAVAERDELSAVLERRQQSVQSLEARARQALAEFESTRSELARAQQMSLGFLKEEADQKREITATETRLQSLREEEQRLEERHAEATRRKDGLREQLADLQTRVAAAQQEKTDFERALEEAQIEVVAAESALQEAREARESATDELARLESRYEMAMRIASELEGYRAGAAALLRDPERSQRLRGAMAERLRVEPGYEAAFELVFGEDADALLVGDVRDAEAMASHLAREGLGLASFLAELGPGEAAPVDSSGLPGRSALEVVSVDEKDASVLRRWLERVRVVETNAEAIEGILEHGRHGFSFLSREALFLRHDGLVRGGSGARRELSLFGRQEQLEELDRQVKQQRELVEQRQRVQQERRDQLEAARRRVEQQRGELQRAGAALTDLQRELAARKGLLQREEEQGQSLETELERVRGEIESHLGRIERLQQELGRHGADQEASQKRVEELGAEVLRLESEKDEAQRALSQAGRAHPRSGNRARTGHAARAPRPHGHGSTGAHRASRYRGRDPGHRSRALACPRGGAQCRGGRPLHPARGAPRGPPIEPGSDRSTASGSGGAHRAAASRRSPPARALGCAARGTDRSDQARLFARDDRRADPGEVPGRGRGGVSRDRRGNPAVRTQP